MDANLTPEEIKFFETGDASHLSAPTPEPTLEPTPEPTPAPAPEPTPTPVPVPAPDPAAEIRALLEQERASRAALEERIALLAQRVSQPPPAPPPQVPDKETDPLGHLFHNINNLNQTVSKLEQSLQAQQAQEQSATQFQQFVTRMQSMRNEFAKQTPDFADAYAHLRTVRSADLRDVGLSDVDIERALLQDEIAVSQNALQRGQNPAQVIYNMAQRYGYAKRAAAPAASNVADKIAQIAQSQATAAPARAAATSELTVDSLKDMSNTDLNRTVNDDMAWRRLMGGGDADIFHN